MINFRADAATFILNLKTWIFFWYLILSKVMGKFTETWNFLTFCYFEQAYSALGLFKITKSVLRVKMNIFNFLNIFFWFLIPKLVYKGAFTFCLTVLVKKLQMVFGPFLTICNFLTNTVRQKVKAPLYTNLGMRNQKEKKICWKCSFSPSKHMRGILNRPNGFVHGGILFFLFACSLTNPYPCPATLSPNGPEWFC